MNQLPPSEARPPKKGLKKGCLVALIAAGAFILLFVLLMVLCYTNREKLMNWGVGQGTAQMERILARRSGPGYDTTRIHFTFEEYRLATREGRINLDSLRDIVVYMKVIGDTEQPLDTFKINQILSNLKGSILSVPDPRWKK